MKTSSMRCSRRYCNEHLAFARGENVFEGQVALAFLGFAIARGDEAAKPAIGGAIGRIGQRLEAVDRHQAGADEKLYLSVFCFVIGAHHAGKRIAVGDADGGQSKLIGGRHYFLRMRGAAQKGKICGYGQFGIRAHVFSRTKTHPNKPLREQVIHANKPCTNQRAAAVSRS